MTKILVFGLPRTATTSLQFELSILFRIKSLNEPFGSNTVITDNVYKWVQSQDDCTMKLLTTNLCQPIIKDIDIIKIINSGVTHLVVTQRSNLVDCCVSLYYAERVAKKYHYSSDDVVKHVPFEFDMTFLSYWLPEIDMYYQVLEQLKQHQITYDVFDYDEYVKKHQQEIFGYSIGMKHNQHWVYSNIDYSSLCSNYQEVKTAIDDYIKGIQR